MNGLWFAAIHVARHTSSRAASICVFMSASLNAMAWFSMIGRPNCLALLGVVERVLVGRTGNTERLRADQRTAGLERAHRGLHPRALTLAGTRESGVELLLAAEQQRARDAAVVEDDLGGVATPGCPSS